MNSPILYMFPEEELNKLISKIDRIEKHLKGQDEASISIGNYISEKEAMKILNRKTTWFWGRRKDGSLPYKAIGRTKYYHWDDIKALLGKGEGNS